MKVEDYAADSYEPNPPEDFEPLAPARLWTETGLAERVMLEHGDRLRLIKGSTRWLEWDGTRWLHTGRERLMRLVAEAVGACYAELAELPDEARQKAARKVIEWDRVGIQRAIADYLPAVADRHGRVVTLAQLDRLPNRIATPVGIVNLATGDSRPAQPSEYITRVTAVAPRYEAGAWHRFVERAVPDEEIRRYVQQAVGASVLGRHREDKFWTIWGPEGTGKTTFSQALTRALGDYANTARWQSLAPSRYESGAAHRADLFRIVGSRLVTVEELPEDATLDGALIKVLSGGSPVPVRAPYSTESVMLGDVENFWIATNFRPRLDGSDGALFRRVVLLTFTTPFANNKADRNLREEVWSEDVLPEVMGWIVRGAQAYLADPALLEPQEVLSRIEAYRRELDPLRIWVEERLVRDLRAECRLDELVEHAESWATDNGLFTSERDVRKRLQKLGIATKRLRDDVTHERYWAVRGVRLRTEADAGHAGHEKQPFSESPPTRARKEGFMESAVLAGQGGHRSPSSGECPACGALPHLTASGDYACLCEGQPWR